MSFGKSDVLQFIDVAATEVSFGCITSPKSIVVAVCAVCQKRRNVTYLAVRKAVKKYGNSMCGSCRRNTDEFKRESSRRTKAMWDDLDYRKRVTRSSKGAWDDERRKTQSDVSKAM